LTSTSNQLPWWIFRGSPESEAQERRHHPLRTEDEKTIQDFLNGEPGAVARIGSWILTASQSFRARLGSEWEDVRQDVLVELTRLFREGSFRGHSALSSYIWSVTNHACIKRLRRIQRWTSDGEEILIHHPDSRQSVHESLSARDRMQSIHNIALRMSADCRTLWARIAAGQSYREMSAALGIAEGALRVRILRCRQKAQRLRDEQEGGESR